VPGDDKTPKFVNLFNGDSRYKDTGGYMYPEYGVMPQQAYELHKRHSDDRDFNVQLFGGAEEPFARNPSHYAKKAIDNQYRAVV
jgi:hypothetical protein